MTRLWFIHSAVVGRWPKATDLVLRKAEHQEETYKAHLACENKGSFQRCSVETSFCQNTVVTPLMLHRTVVIYIFQQCQQKKRVKKD